MLVPEEINSLPSSLSYQASHPDNQSSPIILELLLNISAGPHLSSGHGLHETSSVLVETVSKTSAASAAYASFPKFSSDASKVLLRGAGLSKAFIGQKNSFTVDCSGAGEAVAPLKANNRWARPPKLSLCLHRHQHVDGGCSRTKSTL